MLRLENKNEYGKKNSVGLKNRVLIIEDDHDIRLSLEDALEVIGVSALSVSDGEQALKILETIDPPCVILLDMMMPNMNGWQFRSEQQRNIKIADIPVVIVSADVNAEKHAKSIGAVECLRKPFEFETLVRVVKQYCLVQEAESVGESGEASGEVSSIPNSLSLR